MRSSALGTPDTADPKETGTIRKEDAPFIVSVDGQTGRNPVSLHIRDTCSEKGWLFCYVEIKCVAKKEGGNYGRYA